jgi:hypothetical protein
MKFLALLFTGVLLLLLGLLSGCDNDGSGNAAGACGIDTPWAETAGCPCFTMDDVMSMSTNAVAVSCENTV